MNVTLIVGNKFSMGMEFDNFFDEFCKKEIKNGTETFLKEFCDYTEKNMDATGGKENTFTFRGFGEFADRRFKELSGAKKERFEEFVESFTRKFVNEYYDYDEKFRQGESDWSEINENQKSAYPEKQTWAKKNNLPPELVVGKREWFEGNFKDSLEAIFSRAVFSEVSYRYLRDKCSLWMSRGEDGTFEPDDRGLSSGRIDYKIFNFNYGDLLWKCVLSHLDKLSDEDFAELNWKSSHTTKKTTWSVHLDLNTVDVRFTQQSSYVHGDMSEKTSDGGKASLDAVRDAVSESHVICIYGLSPEEAAYDGIWGEILTRLKENDVTLVIFDFDGGYDPREMYSKRMVTDRYLKLLKDIAGRTGNNPADMTDIKDKIHFAHGKNIFSVDWYCKENTYWGRMYDDDRLRFPIIES